MVMLNVLGTKVTDKLFKFPGYLCRYHQKNSKIQYCVNFFF